MSKAWDKEIDLRDLVGGGRLGTGVKKGWMIGGPVQESGEGSGGREERGEGGGGRIKGKEKKEDGVDEVRTFCIEWGGM